MAVYRFRDCVMDTVERTVRKNSRYLELTPKTFDVLQLLVEHAGEIVTKDELLGTVWNGSFVEEGNLPVHVSKLRRLLGESKAKRCIQTIPGIGYRFSVYTDPGKDLQASISNDFGAYRNYLKGKYLQNKHTVEEMYKAIDCFQKSVSYDPMNLRGYVEIVESFMSLFAYDAISRIMLDEKTGPILGIIRSWDESDEDVLLMHNKLKVIRDWDFRSGEHYVHAAISMNPNSVKACIRHAELSLWTGRSAGALRMLQKAVRLDPVSVTNFKRIGRVSYGMGLYDNALTYLGEALEMEANDHETLTLLGAVLAEIGQYSRARSVLQKSTEINNSSEPVAMLAYVDALAGNRQHAEKAIDSFAVDGPPGCGAFTKLAMISFVLGRKKQGFDFLDQALESREFDFLAVAADPRFNRVKNDQRFGTFKKHLGLVS